jgi:Domain of unknown function (DUF4326)
LVVLATECRIFTGISGTEGAKIESVVVRDAADAVGMYRLWLHGCARGGAPFPIETLRGKNLACWCPDRPYHADVLLELAKELRKT